MTFTPALSTPVGERTSDPAIVIAALSYAVAGWPVVPLHTPLADAGCSCADRDCASAGKHPRTEHGLSDASIDPDRIAAWWRQWPHANIGVRTGELVVIDIDGTAGRQSLHELQATRGTLPVTRSAMSARGAHLYFHADGHDVGCSAGRIAPGIDVRGRGGYIVAPPSRHALGPRYRWANTAPIAPLPERLTDLLAPATSTADRAALPLAVTTNGGERARRYLQAAADAELLAVARAATGTRNATLNRAAFRLGQLAGAGLGESDQLANALLGAAVSAGLGEREARATITSGLNAGQRNPRPVDVTD